MAKKKLKIIYKVSDMPQKEMRWRLDRAYDVLFKETYKTWKKNKDVKK